MLRMFANTAGVTLRTSVRIGLRGYRDAAELIACHQGPGKNVAVVRVGDSDAKVVADAFRKRGLTVLTKIGKSDEIYVGLGPKDFSDMVNGILKNEIDKDNDNDIEQTSNTGCTV